MHKNIIKLIAASLALCVSQFALPASAHHRSGHQGGPPHSSGQSELSEPLTSVQRTLLSDLLNGRADSDSLELIDTSTRQEIRAQINSLPPGIQQRLARGRSLPPGIAKKVVLSNRINEYLEIGDDVQVIVIGPDAAVIDPVTGAIIDILREVLF